MSASCRGDCLGSLLDVRRWSAQSGTRTAGGSGEDGLMLEPRFRPRFLPEDIGELKYIHSEHAKRLPAPVTRQIRPVSANDSRMAERNVDG